LKEKSNYFKLKCFHVISRGGGQLELLKKGWVQKKNKAIRANT